jgi:hypothetical protein
MERELIYPDEATEAATVTAYSFTLELNGRVYRCESRVTGNTLLRQTIHVEGVGSKRDIARYGPPNRHPPEVMPVIARMIAREILLGGAVRA